MLPDPALWAASTGITAQRIARDRTTSTQQDGRFILILLEKLSFIYNLIPAATIHTSDQGPDLIFPALAGRSAGKAD
jgi:hypothetical protein